jgi:hypothetical protein
MRYQKFLKQFTQSQLEAFYASRRASFVAKEGITAAEYDEDAAQFIDTQFSSVKASLEEKKAWYCILEFMPSSLTPAAHAAKMLELKALIDGGN